MGGGGGGGKAPKATPAVQQPAETATKEPETASRESGTVDQQKDKARAAALSRDTGTVLTGSKLGEANTKQKTVLGG